MMIVMKIIKKRQPCVIPYRKSDRVDDIQHQLPPTGSISRMMVGMRLVISGMVHIAPQINVFLVFEVVGIYKWRVTVSRVVTDIASTEKSDADTESWPMNPLTTHGVPALSCPVLIKMIPDTELLRVFVNSMKRLVLSCPDDEMVHMPATIRFNTSTWRKF